MSERRNQSFTPPIVHRDIKPSNIILTEDGRIVLIDLNAARLDDKNRSHDTQLIGTAGFATPEQYGFAASSPRADLYAAGILMRMLLTGTDAKDDMLSRHLSRKIRAIIERCTQLDPRKRYPSAQALQRDIRKHFPRHLNIPRPITPFSESTAAIHPIT